MGGRLPRGGLFFVAGSVSCGRNVAATTRMKNQGTGGGRKKQMRVLINGATGKMGGREVCKAVQSASDLVLVGGVDSSGRNLAGIDMFTNLNKALAAARPDVVVDFTTPQAIGGPAWRPVSHIMCPW